MREMFKKVLMKLAQWLAGKGTYYRKGIRYRMGEDTERLLDKVSIKLWNKKI